MGTMKKRTSKHRFLFNKDYLVRKATADLAIYPDSAEHRGYLRGLCDALHGTRDTKVAQAIHVARQTIIATKEV